MLDRGHQHGPDIWNRSSPQHIDARTQSRLFPKDLLDEVFATVRHPIPRLVSVYRFQRDIEKRINPSLSFEDWICALPYRWREDPFYLDNHPLPMDRFLRDHCHVFRLEDGLEAVVAWLDKLAGNSEGRREIRSGNSYEYRLERNAQMPGPQPNVTDKARARIFDLYAADFERFEYDPEIVT